MNTRVPFEQAVRMHGATVLRVCRSVLGPGPDADDAWSETFLAALRVWPDLDEETNVEAWLVRVAQRKAIDAVRARARREVPSERLPERTSDVGVPGRNDGDVWEVVADLPDRQRQAVAYHYLAGLPHAATAELIGGSPESVRRAASDGVRTLRKRLRVEQPWKGSLR